MSSHSSRMSRSSEASCAELGWRWRQRDLGLFGKRGFQAACYEHVALTAHSPSPQSVGLTEFSGQLHLMVGKLARHTRHGPNIRTGTSSGGQRGSMWARGRRCTRWTAAYVT